MPECKGRANQNAHPTTRMEYQKKWKIQGAHQKRPLLITLYKCPECGKSKRVGTYV